MGVERKTKGQTTSLLGLGAIVATLTVGAGTVVYSQSSSLPPGTIGIEGEIYSVFPSPNSKGISISGYINDVNNDGDQIRYRFIYTGNITPNDDGTPLDELTKVSFCGAQMPIDTEKHCVTYQIEADIGKHRGDFSRIVADARNIVPEGGFSVSLYKAPKTK
tara:strand:- start:890 stop:1375 length:486 start_codon:yes stop_codon:yes gene_type:complete